MAVKEALLDSKHGQYYVAAKTAKLDVNILRLMADRSSLPPNKLGPDRQPRPDKADTQPPFAATTTKAIRVKSETPASFDQMKGLAFILLTAAATFAIMWAAERADPAWIRL